MKALADTGLIVAYGNRTDRFHSWAVEIARTLTEPLRTCEAVLAEAAYLLQDRAGLAPEKLLALFERGIISVSFRLDEHAALVARLLERYRDQEMQLADACLVRMSELKRDCRVFTLDKSEFQVYRRFERQLIPLVAPD